MTPSGESLYTARTVYPDVLARGRANAVQMAIYRSNALVAPASGTFSLLKPDGTALVDAAAVTITSSIATYSIPAGTLPTTLTPLGEGWQELWALTISGVEYTYQRSAALARIQLAPAITDADLLLLYPTLGDLRGTRIASFQPFIDGCWNTLVQRLLRDGHLPYLIRQPDALREALLHGTLELAFRSFSLTAEGQHYADLATHHCTRARSAYESANWQADYDHDGRIDDPGTRRRPATVLHTMGVPEQGSPYVRSMRASRWT